MIDFKNLYNQRDFLSYLNEYYPDFEPKNEELQISKKFKYIKSVIKLGKSKKLDLNVYEVEHVSENDPRVTLSKEAFSILREYIARKSLVIFKNENTQNYRLSLITFQSNWESGNKITTEFSNPRRYSFFLGPDAKVKTPTRFLIDKGKIIDFDDLKNRFSLEVVNKEFYKDISEQFIKLVGGSLSKGKKKIEYPPLLKLPSISDKSQKSVEFAVRLIGRVIFCWFLREKKSLNRKSLVPKDLLSYEAIEGNADYYHKVLEPIFFEILNKQIKTRRDEFGSDLFSSIPYLNGGLFSPQEDDFYKRNSSDFQSQYHNTLIIPDQWFTEFFEVLETYNFTIDENTSFDEELSIDPEMLGRIFENLLAEINPETGESARKSTGSYYTPRVIVDYMVDESLLLYLKEQTKIDETKLRAIVSYDLDDDINNPTTDDEKQKIVNALEKVKILDPACGSGAFPIGALQKIVFILQQIDPNGKLWKEKQLAKADPEFRKDIEKRFSNKEYNFIRKLGIIRDCIYGIDIQPIATEISRLRCFLTLIVDEQVDDEAENRGIKPLPNLDFKFVTANSLIGLPKVNEPQGSMFDDYQKIDELKKIRDEYFNSSGIEREQLKTQFVTQQKLLFKDLQKEHGWQGINKAELTNKLTDWDPFTHKSTPWFDPEWMFGIKEGFDIVIGNPPYIQLQKSLNNGTINKYADIYKKSNFVTFDRTGDIYCLFYERGIIMLKQKGCLSYITSNKWMRTGYGEKIRNFFTSLNPLILIDLGPGVFESATVDTNVLVIQKAENSNNMKAVSIKTKNDISITEILKNNGTILSKISSDVWSIGNEAEQKIKEKIEKIGKPLRDWNVNIYRGVLTGLNEAYIIDTLTKERLCKEDPKSLEILKPILRGRDIQRYGHKWAGIWLIASDFDIDVPKLYPAIYKYLKQFELKAKKRDDQGKSWWNLRACAYYPEFEKEKVIWKRIGSVLRFGYDIENLYGQDSTCIMTGSNLKYICAFMNSKLGNKLLFDKAPKTGTGDVIVSVQALEPLLIPPITDDNKSIIDSIEILVNKIIAIKRQNIEENISIFEKQIDQMVYKLYSLTEEEIKIVES